MSARSHRIGRGIVASRARAVAARGRTPGPRTPHPARVAVESVEPRVLFASLWISDAVVAEGNAGTTDAVFTVTLFQPTDQPVSVNYATSNNSATTPEDYAVRSGTLNFTPGGPTSQTITVPVTGDTLPEANELFFVTLSSPTNANVVGAEGRGYIADDDQSFLTVHNVQVAEGSSGTTNAVLTVHRLGSLGGTTSVNYNAAASTATTPADFAATSNTLVFGPGVATQTVTVPITADQARETLEETFNVNLSAAQNGTIVVTSGQGTILDDDPAPTVTRVYVGSTAWLGNDNNASTTRFKEYLQAQGLGSADYGFAVADGAAQLLTLPWINLNQVSMTFSQDVAVQKDDLSVRGTNTPTYAFAPGDAGFEYNPLTRTATWTFAAPFAVDRMLLDLDAASPNGVRNAGGEFLDGEWTNGADAYPSGNGSAGGDFQFRLNVLPGDTLRDNTVLARDYADVKKKFFKNTTSPVTGTDNDYAAFYDIDGSGSILATDYAEVKKRFFNQLPAAQPTAAALFGTASIGAGPLRDLLA